MRLTKILNGITAHEITVGDVRAFFMLHATPDTATDSDLLAFLIQHRQVITAPVAFQLLSQAEQVQGLEMLKEVNKSFFEPEEEKKIKYPEGFTPKPIPATRKLDMINENVMRLSQFGILDPLAMGWSHYINAIDIISKWNKEAQQ
jgi:hypothetical protein